MLRGITVRQFAEWRAYADLEPFDEERADARAAQVVQAVLNVNRRRGSQPIPFRDCLLSFGDTPPPKPTAAPKTAKEAREAAAKVRQTMDALVVAFGPKRRRRG